MKQELITALAREYAEGMCSHMEDDFIKDEAIRDKEEAFRLAVEHLSRRYCLVEKSKIKEMWNEITNLYLAHQHITYDGARYLFNEVFFPEIGKEVEDA